MAEGSAPRAAKRVALNMKASPDLRAKIDAAARESGLSVAQEVERRLLASMAEDDQAGGLVQGDLIRTMKLVMNAVNRKLGAPWWKHQDGWKIVNGSFARLLEDMEPYPLVDDAPFDEGVIEEYKREMHRWLQREVRPLREKINLLSEKRRLRGPNRPFTEVEEQELAQAVAKLRSLRISDEPKPKLPDDELERWERHEEWRRRVRSARAAAYSYHNSFFSDYNTDEFFNGA